MMESKHNLFSTDAKEQLFEAVEAPIMAQPSVNMMRSCQPESGTFAQQCNYKQGVKKCGDRAEKAALKETKQQHVQMCFSPIAVAELTQQEKERAQEALMHVTEKQDPSMKGHMTHNRKPTRDWLTKEDTSSPTVGLDSSFFTLYFSDGCKGETRCDDS